MTQQHEDIALATTLDTLEATPDIIVDQLWASATEYYKRDDLDRARDYLDKLIKMRPDNVRFLTLLGVVYRRQKRRAAALICFQKAAKLDQTYRNALVNLGETLIEVGKVPAGVKLLRAVFEEGRDPSKPPEEQDEFTIRAGAMLEFVQQSINAFVEHERGAATD
ncbi:MAG: tetratricopeptide repeat protein [Persicimonas sp.]